MKNVTVTSAAPVQLMPSGASRWVTAQNNGTSPVRVKHDATGDAVSVSSGTIVLPGEILQLSDAPAASEITAQSMSGTCVVSVQTGSI